MHYVGKFEVGLAYGGPEEGGWYFDSGMPVWRFAIPVPFEGLAYRLSRWLNGREKQRQEREEQYDYTSVLAYRSTHYGYKVGDSFRLQPYPSQRPVYE